MLAYILFAFLFAYAQGLYMVNTTEGYVQINNKAADGDYFAFYGIPYAGPTSGNNRFKGPVPPSRHPNVFHATDNNVICAQPSTRGLIGTENCLTLSIFTNNLTSTRPVFVWLNTEEYTETNNQLYSTRRLMEENVVFVKMNFRLSVFGFLCLGVPEAPGNAGLKDVLLGLKWVKANIANFGGDPNNVVLIGHAAGAAMVDLLTLSPETKNLVHKGIALSGSGLAPWAVAYDPIGYAEILGAKLGYAGKTRKDLAKHLISTDINVLHTALNDFRYYNNTPLFAPCIENPKLNDSFLLEAPISTLRSGKYNEIPFIYGYTNREGTMRASEAEFGDWLYVMQTNFVDFLPVDLQFHNNRSAIESIRNFYFRNSSISMETIEDFLDYEGDVQVLISVIKAAKERSIHGSEVRLLEFAYLGTQNTDWFCKQVPLRGARHGSFINYIFDYDLRAVDEVVSKSIVKRLAEFAYTWKPLPSSFTANNTVSWTPITKETINYLYYSGNEGPTPNNTSIYVEEIRFNPHVQRTNFWDELYSKYYVAPKPLNSASVTLSCICFVFMSQFVIHLL